MRTYCDMYLNPSLFVEHCSMTYANRKIPILSTSRPSASDALQHPFFQNADERSSSGLGIASNAIASASRSMGSVFASVDDAIMSGADEGLLTEARLYEELGIDKAAPVPTRQASSTIAWWQERQVWRMKGKVFEIETVECHSEEAAPFPG